MEKMTKTWLIIAAVLVVIGCLIFGGVMAMVKWDFTKLSTIKFENNEYEMNEKFSNIRVKTETAKITFKESNDGTCRVECYEDRKSKHTVTVEEDTLVIDKIQDKAWYNYIGINIGTPKITVYFPETEYRELFVKVSTGDVKIPSNFKFESADIYASTGDVEFLASVSEGAKIETSTGKICVENATLGEMELTTTTGGVNLSNICCESNINIGVTTGKVNLAGVECQNLTSSGSTGNIILSNVVATEKFSIDRTTGNIKFDNSDANEIFAETKTGDIKGTLRTDKVFIARTSVGKIDVPKTVTGGRCEISSDTGKIEINVIS